MILRLTSDIQHAEDLVQQRIYNMTLSASCVLEIKRPTTSFVSTALFNAAVVFALVNSITEARHLLQSLVYTAKADIDLGPFEQIHVSSILEAAEEPGGALDDGCL